MMIINYGKILVKTYFYKSISKLPTFPVILQSRIPEPRILKKLGLFMENILVSQICKLRNNFRKNKASQQRIFWMLVIKIRERKMYMHCFYFM